MSDDGRYTLFETDMHGLVPEDTRAEPYNSNNSNNHLYLYDADRGSVTLKGIPEPVLLYSLRDTVGGHAIR